MAAHNLSIGAFAIKTAISATAAADSPPRPPGVF